MEEKQMDDYPKRMRYYSVEVTVLAAANRFGIVPIQYPGGAYAVVPERCLTPIPSPDDEVEVVVRMTRAQRDTSANGTWPALAHQIVAACRAHRVAEQAEGGTE